MTKTDKKEDKKVDESKQKEEKRAKTHGDPVVQLY